MTTAIAVPEKPHLSPTQIDLYTKCGEAYRRRYIEGHKVPPGLEAIKGTGVHVGAAVNFRQKRETRRDLPASEIIDAAVSSFEKGITGGYTLTDDEIARGTALTIGRAKDQVSSIAQLLATDVAPNYQPLYVEQQVRILLPNATHDMLGVLDLADDQRRIIDFKTSARAKSQDEADHSPQLTFYAAAHRVLTGELPDEVRLEVLVKKKIPERQIVRSTRGLQDFQALANRINAILAGINAGVFPPATPGAWWCSQKWCGYWHSCPYINSERRAIAEQQNYSPSLVRQLQMAVAEVRSSAEIRKGTYKNPRDRLLAEDPHCRRCGAKLTKLTAKLDHLIPIDQGGTNAFSNYCLTCRGGCAAKEGLETPCTTIQTH